MATAIRMSRPSLLGVGAFGQRVVDALSKHYPNGKVVSDAEQAFSAALAPVVVAMWRPSPALCERADVLAHATGTPWLPVVMEHQMIWVGPLVWPGLGPCYRCYRDRRAQHDRRWQTTKLLEEAYDRGDTTGPTGFLPHHARLAAGATVAMLTHQTTPVSAAIGRVTMISLFGQSMSSASVVARHGCRRCNLPMPKRDLADLLPLGEVELSAH